MSKKNTRIKPKLLIDTTFILPALGFEVEENAMKAIEKFRMFDIYYIEIGILEAMWRIMKVIDKNSLDIVIQGIDAIKNTYNKLEIPSDAYRDSYYLYSKGHKDLIDALYYFASIYYGIPFLTIDDSFIEFLSKNGYKINLIYKPEEIDKLL